MTLTPRKAEIDALLEILEPDGMDNLDPEEVQDARHAAGLLLKAAYEILRRRDWWIIGHQPGPLWDPEKVTVAYGIEPSEIAARKAAERLGWGIYAVKAVHGLGAFEDDLAAHQAAALDKFGDIPCARCKHLKVHHGAMKQSRGTMVHDTTAARITCSSNCTCPGYLGRADHPGKG